MDLRVFSSYFSPTRTVARPKLYFQDICIPGEEYPILSIGYFPNILPPSPHQHQSPVISPHIQEAGLVQG